MSFVNISGPVVANTVYSDGKLAARDVAITLPELSPMSADLQAMGTFSLPIWQLLENMETTVTKIGTDEGFRAMIKPDMKPFECRWVQTLTDANGHTRNVGCKAFITGIPSKIPGIDLEVGKPSENEIPIATSRYVLYVDGKEMIYVDRFAGIVRIDGKDYANLNSML